MFFDNFESTVDKLRLALRSLRKINYVSIQKSSDFKKITTDYQLKHDYFSKSSHATTLSKIVEDKYSAVKDRYFCEIKGLSKEQRSVDKEINKIFKKGKEYFELSLYEDFIPKGKFYDLVINLTKGHKVGRVDSKVLHNLKSYKEVEFKKGSVYVKDNRTQYSDIILVNDKNEILFLIRNKDDDFEPGKYCLPGGHVEANENFKAAAIRECSEETGIELKMSEVVSCGNYIDSKSNIHYFTAKFNGDPVVLQEKEQIQYEWVPIDNIAEKPLLLNLKQNLAEVVEMPKGIFNSSDKSLEGHYFDGSCIVLDDDILVQKSLDSLCFDFNADKISVNELNDSLSKIFKPFERYYIRKGNEFKAFVRLVFPLEKGRKPAEIGEIREWSGHKYQKTANGWILEEDKRQSSVGITYDNFYENTEGTFRMVSKPERDPDYISYKKGDPYHRISSEYWYGKDSKGSFVIRGSDHWSGYLEGDSLRKKGSDIASCNWKLENSSSFDSGLSESEKLKLFEKFEKQTKSGSRNPGVLEKEKKEAERLYNETLEHKIFGKVFYGKIYLDGLRKRDSLKKSNLSNGVEIVMERYGRSSTELEIKEWDGKIYRKTDTGWKLFEEDIEKAIRGGSLIKKRRLVTRGGKTFLTTVWVKPDGAIEKEETKKELPADSRISDLTVGEEVTLTTARGDKEGTVSSLVDTKEGICIVLRTPTGKATEVYLKALRKVTKRNASKTEPVLKPEPKTWSIDDFKLVKSLGGSSEVSLYEIEGTKIVLKKERLRESGKDQLKDEALADKLYQVMGIDAPTSIVKEYDGVFYKESIFIEGREYGSLTGKDKEKAKEIIREGFVMDCLLGNWDVIGASGDNVLVTGTGDSLKVYRIDNGSALRHRARGAIKPLDAFLLSTSIPELSSMRDSRLNPSAASVFEGITEEEILEQSKNILSKKEDILSVITDAEIKRAIEKRLNYLNSIVTEEKEKSEDKIEGTLEKGMPSLVTQNYFSDWDSFDFVANKECKQTIKDRIIEFEKNREGEYSECAKELGISLEEYKEKLQSLTEQIFAKSSPFIAIDGGSVLPLIFTEGGRFKSQFETKTSKGSMSPSLRAGTEYGYFGIDKSIDKNKELRPVYGYMSNNKNGVYSKDGKVPPTVCHYGNVYVEIEREKALKSATCTFGDSLGDESFIMAVPFGKPHFTVLNGFTDPGLVKRNIREAENYIKGITNCLDRDIAGGYAEIQYHNKLELSDVKTIHISPESFYGNLSEMSSVVNNLNKFSASVGKFIPVEIFNGE